ncbi:hypothetical protein Tco_0730972 [Tanacetum coccineum]
MSDMTMCLNDLPYMSDMTMCLNDLSYIPMNNEQNEPTQGDIGETSNNPTQAKCNEFEELYASANEELYPSCDHVTRLDFMAKFTYFKVKAKPEGSIAEGYVAEEALTFSSHYFWDVTTKFNRPDRNVDPPPPTCQFQVFRSVCKSIGLRSVIRFDAQELKKVKWRDVGAASSLMERVS